MAVNLKEITHGAQGWDKDLEANFETLNYDSGWIAPAVLAPFDGTLEYKITSAGLVLRGYVFPRTYSNHTSAQLAQIPVNSITDFGNNKAVIVEQDNGHYATVSVASNGKMWLVSAEGAAGDAIHFDGVFIS